MYLLVLGIAPSAAILAYIYYRDKYEKEPKKLLVSLFVLGCCAIVPVSVLEALTRMDGHEELGIWNAFYYAFISTALIEEGIKYLILYWCIWNNREFNQLFDGIVYSVFVSLGFATIENIIYIYSYGTVVGVVRALTAVPGHAVYGVTMGYYLGLARFMKSRKKVLFYSFIMPVIFHGIYDFLLLTRIRGLLLLFIPYVIYLLADGVRKTNRLAEVLPNK